jgi:ribosome maturation factor RimP
MYESAGNPLFVEAFERIVHALPHQPEFRNVEIVTTSARPSRSETHLAVAVDREGGVDIETVERIAARINAALDAFADPYTLEVSSVGLNRPLYTLTDYERFSGKNVKIVTTLAIANAKTHRGVLDGVRGDQVILRTGKDLATELAIPFASIKAANIEYDVRADLQRAKEQQQPKPAKAKQKS